jgi:hypothetical protein
MNLTCKFAIAELDPADYAAVTQSSPVLNGFRDDSLVFATIFKVNVSIFSKSEKGVV